MACCKNTDSNTMHLKNLRRDKNSPLLLKPSINSELFVNQVSNPTPKNSNGLKRPLYVNVMALTKCITSK